VSKFTVHGETPGKKKKRNRMSFTVDRSSCPGKPLKRRSDEKTGSTWSAKKKRERGQGGATTQFRKRGKKGKNKVIRSVATTAETNSKKDPET